jgi:hypothetical protein
MGLKEGLGRILAKLDDIAFWVVAIADARTLKLPLALRPVELTTERLRRQARRGDAWDREDKVDRCVERNGQLDSPSLCALTPDLSRSTRLAGAGPLDGVRFRRSFSLLLRGNQAKCRAEGDRP